MGKRTATAVFVAILFLIPLLPAGGWIAPYSGEQDTFSGGQSSLEVQLAPGVPNASASFLLPAYAVVTGMSVGVGPSAGAPSNLKFRVGSGNISWAHAGTLGGASVFDDGAATKTYGFNDTWKNATVTVTVPQNSTNFSATLNVTGIQQGLGAGIPTHYQTGSAPGIISNNANVHWYDPGSDTVFVGTGAGLTVINFSSGTRTDITSAGTGWAKLPGNNVLDLFYAPAERILLAGTASGGAVLNFSSSTSTFYTTGTTPALPANNVEAVWYDSTGGRAFFGTLGKGLSCIHLPTGTRTVYDTNGAPAMPSDDVTCVRYSPASDILFVGTNADGVCVLNLSYNPPTLVRYSTATTPRLVHNAVRQVDYNPADQSMYVATQGGVTVINLGTNNRRDYTVSSTPSIPGVMLESLDYEPSSGKLYIATGSSGGNGAGVAVINTTSGSVTVYTVAGAPALLGDNARYVSYCPEYDRMFVSMTPSGGPTQGGLTRIDFSRWPGNVSLDVGNDGTPEWAVPVPLAGVSTADLSQAFTSYISSATPLHDSYGNALFAVPVGLRAGIPGQISLRNLSVRYNATLYPANLAEAVNSYIRTQAPGANITVRLNFTSDTAAAIRLSVLAVRYDVVPPANHPPVISSSPPMGALAGAQYVYQMTVTDEDNDTLTYSLTRSPAGMTINASSGRVVWTPSRADVGRHSVSAQVSDGGGTAYQNWTLDVSTVAGNAPPAFDSYPPTAATVGVEYYYDANATDPDNGDRLNFSLDVCPPGMAMERSTGIITWVPQVGDAGSVAVKINVTDGKDCLYQSYNITVMQAGMNNLPLITSSPPINATVGVSYSYKVRAIDIDGDTLQFVLKAFPVGMTMNELGEIQWTPSTDQTGDICVLVNVLDGKGYSYQSFTIMTLTLNHLPYVTSVPPQKIKPGSTLKYCVTAMDVDTGDTIVMSLKSGPPGMYINNTTLFWKPTKASKGPNLVVVNVSDGRDTYLHSFTLSVVISAPAEPAVSLTTALLAVMVVLAIALAGVGYLQYRSRKKPALAPAKPSEEFTIEDIFLVYDDGRLLKHTSRRIKHEMDRHVLTSMLTAIQSFVEVGLSKEENVRLGSMEYGHNKILFERGKRTIMSVVISGCEHPELRSHMKQTVVNIDAECGTVLEDWDGDAKKVEPAVRHLEHLSAFRPEQEQSAQCTPLPAELNLKLMSEIEFYQGYVRFKIALKNDSDSVITDATLKLVFDEAALRLDRIEPRYEIFGREVVVGNVGRKEKKTVAFYLDPVMCNESHIDGVLSFKDHRGELRHLSMKRKLVSVVCPLLHTEENINVAMLKKMLRDELDKQDRKLFRLPEGTAPKKALELAKAAVQKHDLRLVREYVQEEGHFRGETWYFGAVKGRNEKLVIKVMVDEAGRTIEFLAASASVLILTGMLAELKTDLDGELRAAGASGVQRIDEEPRPDGSPRPDALTGSLLEKAPDEAPAIPPPQTQST